MTRYHIRRSPLLRSTYMIIDDVTGMRVSQFYETRQDAELVLAFVRERAAGYPIGPLAWPDELITSRRAAHHG